MDWSYVAGFFDGEGCIYWRHKEASPRYNSPMLSIGQAISNRTPIDALAAFLTKNRIQFTLGRQTQRKAQDMIRVRVLHRDHVAAMLKGMLPFLLLKRYVAVAALHFIESRTWRQRRPRPEACPIVRPLPPCALQESR